MVGEGKLKYTALMVNVRLLPVDSDLADTLRMGSEHLRRRYGVRASGLPYSSIGGFCTIATVLEPGEGAFPWPP